jgi:RNA polymerase sigma-70 factor (ECF subfamily)
MTAARSATASAAVREVAGSRPDGGTNVQSPAQQVQESVAEDWVAPSWEEVVTNHSAKVFRLAYRLTGNKYDAEDLTQEVFVRVFRSLANFKPGTLDGWLHRITTNLFLDQARRKTRIRFDALADDAESRLPGREPGPERSFEYNNLDIDVQAALEALPPDFRAAVVLCDLEGLSYDEVAEALDVKLGTVRSRIHRGRTMLRESLAHRAPGRSGVPLDGTAELPAAKKPATARLKLPRIARVH